MPQLEPRTVGEFVKAKLGISLVEYAKRTGVTTSHLYKKWASTKGRQVVMNAVFCYYVRVYDEK